MGGELGWTEEGWSGKGECVIGDVVAELYKGGWRGAEF